MTYYKQHASENVPYRVQLSGDVLSSALWSITPSGPVISAPANTSAASTVLVSQITAGTTYQLVVVVTGASGGKWERGVEIKGV
jgi:hypothetical protein